jgi:Zn-dependent protease with chaperone function
MSSEEIWRRKSDDELLAAAQRLDEYTEQGQSVIRAEIERRSSPEYLLAQEAAAPRAEAAQRQTYSPRPFKNQTAWLVKRALLAIALMVGFYVFALAIVLVLLSIPYLEWTYVGRLHIKIAAVCIGASVTILWALVPRPDRFEPPGPRLDESLHPRLFRLIREVATATRQVVPTDVYLLNEVNAWVTHRGGTMGFGSHRVMGVGMPLLQAVSVSEFKGIIAHEFGHYWSGDVKLGPWIYKTRAAIARTIAGVHETFVEAPFLWYGRQFLKLTHAVSRQQEFIADEVAARVAGAPTVASALRRITALPPLFSSYVSDEVLPVLRAGFLPPIATGFDEFLRADRIAGVSQQIIHAAEEEGHTDLFDTHPSLRDRLAALGPRHDVNAPEDVGEPASILITEPEKQARALVEFAWGREAIGKLKPIDWAMVGDSVFAVRWREIAENQSQWLSRFTADALPVGKHAFIRLGSELVGSDEQNVNSENRIARAVHLFAVGIGVLLLDDRWRASTGPGMPVVLIRGSQTFDPFAAVRALAEEVTTPDAWRAECHEFGIAGRPLGNAAAVRAAVKATVARTAITRSAEPPERTGLDQINCYRCKHALPVSAETRGKTVKCPQCGTKQPLPV